MKLPSLTRFLPEWKNALLAIVSAVLLVLAFPDFEIWVLAWVALVPLLWAVEREKESVVRSFALGWIFGTVFFFGTCWWLTFAPITYAGFPPLLAYFLLFCVTVIAGLFPALFAGIISFLVKRFGAIAILAAPFIWVSTELLRYWLTGNNWNAIGYAAAFSGRQFIGSASIGGVYLVGSIFAAFSAFLVWLFASRNSKSTTRRLAISGLALLSAVIFFLELASSHDTTSTENGQEEPAKGDRAIVIAVQPNVPMSGLTFEKWMQLRQKHAALAESALRKLTTDNRQPTTVVFPESPMNFAYEEDPEFRRFIGAFAERNNVNVLFNSAEPDSANKKYFNSAVLVDTAGSEIAQYDKIYLMPFGEFVPAPLRSIIPAFVGTFSFGKEYDLLPIGDARAGVMICFESHFGDLSREFVRRGADVLIEMTNDGYLGPTPILRQHLANAVFRAVETNRPVLRVTNVGITAYINERGEVIDPTQGYAEDTRVWTVSKSDGGQTFYVKYGDWFAWLCTAVMLVLLISGLRGRKATGN